MGAGVGQIMVVTRHPRAGREVAAWGGAARLRGRSVLDVGTGDGRLALDIARYARSVVGVDPSAESVDAARRTAAARGVRNAEFRVGSVGELDALRERFDIAIFTWSL